MENQPITNPAFIVRIAGRAVDQLPEDLYIPPDALRIFLEAFEGPLDLLLYLIKKQNIDILDIPIAEITRQYIEYVDLMRELQIELAAEYLLMAAMLAEIKSRMLLPKPALVEEEPADPRAELVRRLQEYERFKKAACDLDRLPRLERDTFIAEATVPPFNIVVAQPEMALSELFTALKEVWERARLYRAHQIVRETLSIRERMTFILTKISGETFVGFTTFFTPEEGRMGIVVTLIAILELIRQSILELVQAAPFAPIYVRSKGSSS